MDKKNLKILLALFIALNGWLLYVNHSLSQDMVGLESIIVEYETALSNAAFIPPNNQWGFEREGQEVAKVAHPEIERANGGLNIALLFTDRGCDYCVEHEVNLLNELFEKDLGHLERIRVYLLSNNESYLSRLFSADFEYYNINPEVKVLDNDFDFGNPVAIVYDEDMVVQIVHIAEKDNEEKSKNFYSQLETLLNSI